MLYIILARLDFRENDQLITLFSRESGKEVALARSVKKINSKNSAFLEPFFLVEAETVSGKEIKHIFKVVGINGFKNIRKDFDKSVSAKKIVNIISRLVPENGKEPVLFDLLKQWLLYIDKNNINSTLELGFICQSLKILGIVPQLNKCVYCEKSATSSGTEKISFSVPDGGIICLDCASKQKIRLSIILQKNDLNNWKIFLDSSINEWPISASIALVRAIELFFEHHSGSKLAKISQIS